MTKMLPNINIAIEHINLANSIYEIATNKPRAQVIRGLTKQEAVAIKTGEKGIIMRKTKKKEESI